MYPQVFGKYVLERELARGGMARVLLATLRGAGGFEKRLVVKQIRDELAYDEEFVRRFVEEAKTTVALSHPNIVPVYELGVELGTYFLAMEFVEGVSAAELLKSLGASGGRLSPEEGAYVGVEVCRALDYAHRRMKVVHRDVTPRNVMFDEEGQVKVIDFGIAARARVEGHEVFGSPGHMAPEQADGKELTPATDVFAVATLLVELWSGKAPFRRKDAAESAELTRAAARPNVSDIDIRLLPLQEAIALALAVDPRERPQHAEEFGRALRKFLSGVDLGDVARQLGERVRAARARAAGASPGSVKPVGLDRPASRPTATEIGTRTFAARAEVENWTPSADARGDEDVRARDGDGDPIATRALPKSGPPPRADAPIGADVIETLATRPLETDGVGQAPRSVREVRHGVKSRWALVGAGSMLLVAGYVAVFTRLSLVSLGWLGSSRASQPEPTRNGAIAPASVALPVESSVTALRAPIAPSALPAPSSADPPSAVPLPTDAARPLAVAAAPSPQNCS